MVDYELDLVPIRSGFDGKTFWGQARVGTMPGDGDAPPVLVVTAQPALCSGSDIFYGLSQWRSTDLGRTWTGPIDCSEALGRRDEDDGTVVGICDMTPAWHRATGTLLTTGHTVRYRDDKHPIIARRRETAYSTFDRQADAWQPWRTVEMPECPEFANAGAGSAQRVDIDDGTILLPIYYKPVSENWHAIFSATVMRCSFDGRTLRYLEHGSELTVEDPRGLCEPSLIKHGRRFYLTLRNDVRGYVTSGDDGLHFEEPVPWRFDDGDELGNYNTQQHWLGHGDALYLVYTRRGLDNDHVFRHRAPLVMARVDPERLVVLRDTEREVVPNRGARLGNFSACKVTDAMSLVVAAEWMQPEGCGQYGSDNTLWAARILWR